MCYHIFSISMETRKFLAQIITLPGGNSIEGPLPTLVGDPTGRYAFTNLSSIVNVALPYLFGIAGILLFLMLVWGGFDLLTAMGDPKKAETAKNKITNALIGILIIIFAYWLVVLLDYVFKLGVYK